MYATVQKKSENKLIAEIPSEDRSQCHTALFLEIECSSFLTCESCQLFSTHCGWCDDGSRTGLGTCLPGGNDGPVDWYVTSRSFRRNSDLCPSKNWYFVQCQCNGHGTCANTTYAADTDSVPLKCLSCQDKTMGHHCERCVDGYYGNALNGGNCTRCDCNGKATQCDPYKGNCFCMTKGVSGFNCDKCEQKYVRVGDELTIDFVFTFNLNSEDDAHITQINFMTRPPKENTDVTAFAGDKERRFLMGSACHEIERRFGADEFSFGTDANTTFFIYLYDFKSPIIIQISFAQTPTIDWMKFFITFALCFFILLVVAFALWKIKQRFDVYQRRQRMFVEMAQMASRPFASVELDLSLTSPGSKQAATQVAIEPCSNYRAGVVTVAVRLPTGGRKYVPNGQSGFAVASALCFLTPNQLAQLQTPPSPVPDPKAKRKRPPCLFSS
ncbi:unnamed protein product [Soboliphyme baturini]|uniref:Laminin EGF-like domain-containing protein n=1 Tax=Soboliphyme baturini TaxID=241478 RepID=A0A183INB7_9BILA|nr:unnamed protein product [Soboliphyme baturini]